MSNGQETWGIIGLVRAYRKAVQILSQHFLVTKRPLTVASELVCIASFWEPSILFHG